MGRLVLILMLVFIVACEEDPVRRQVDPGPEPYVPADSPDQLVSNLVASWNERNFPEFDRLLGADFTFKFAITDIDASETELGVWDRRRVTASVDAMFSGQPGRTDPYSGSPLSPPVQSISVSVSPVGAWSAEVPAEIEADFWREYDVDMNVFYEGGDIAEVQGRQLLYVALIDSESGLYELRRWEDKGNPNASSPTLASQDTGSSSWGSVLAGF